jgi:hypothetical protein
MAEERIKEIIDGLVLELIDEIRRMRGCVSAFIDKAEHPEWCDYMVCHNRRPCSCGLRRLADEFGLRRLADAGGEPC